MSFDYLLYILLYKDCMTMNICTDLLAQQHYANIGIYQRRICNANEIDAQLIDACQFDASIHKKRFHLSEDITIQQAFRDWIIRVRPWFKFCTGNSHERWTLLNRIYALNPSIHNSQLNSVIIPTLPVLSPTTTHAPSVDIIIASYNTDITWLTNVLSSCQVRILWVYVKNSDKLHFFEQNCTKLKSFHPSLEIRIKNIDNVGACEYAYIWHIIHIINSEDNNEQADVNLFIKDTTVVHISNKSRKSNDSNMSRIVQFLHKLQSPPKMPSSFDTFFNVYKMCTADWKTLYDFQLDDWEFTASSSAAKFKQSNVRPFGKWFKHNKHLCPYKELVQNHGTIVPVALGGLFAVTTCRIRRINTNLWQSLLKDIGTSVSNEKCHYVERTYAILFKMLPPLYKTTDVVIVSAHITGNVTAHEGSLQNAYASRFCLDAKETDIRWCPHLLYTDNDALGERAKSIGWTVIAVTDCKHFTSHKETNLYAKRFKMKPHTLDEVIVHAPNTVVWMDSTRCLANKFSMLDIIDSFQMTSQLCIVGMQNFCAGGMDGDVHDEFYDSIKKDIRYISEQHRFYEFIDANQKHLPHKDPQGVFLWCTNLIYNLRHPMCTHILDQWYNITVDTSIIQDQITMHFVHQQYRKYIGISPVQLYRGYVHPQYFTNTQRVLNAQKHS